MARNRRSQQQHMDSRSASRSIHTGMLLAAAAASKSFERTLMPRNTADQGMVTGISVALVYSTTALFQDLIENSAAFVMRDERLSEDRLRRATMLADILAAGAGAFLARNLAQMENESLGRAAVRTSGSILTLAGLSGFSAGFIQDLLDVLDPSKHRVRSSRTLGVGIIGGGLMALVGEYRRRRAERWSREAEPESANLDAWNIHAWKSLLTGIGVTAGLAAIATGERLTSAVAGKALAQGMVGSPALWRLAGHVGSVGALAALLYAGLDNIYQRVEAGTARLEPSFAKPPESPFVSGSAESHVQWRTMGREGRRHVLTVLSRRSIEKVMGQPAVADPVRVYVGLESARTEVDRVALAMKELQRTGAFDRELLVAVSPTGTGYVNYVAVECCEHYTRGNCATVTLQYSKRPSPLSLDRVWEGRKQFRMLLAAIRRELYKRDPSNRPRLVVFGESLGALTSQDAFLHQGTQGLEDAGVERALWIGSPHLSKWRAQVMEANRADVDSALVIDVNGFTDIEALHREARKHLRYVMLTHHNDGVGLFGADLTIQKPAWLGDPELRPPTVPPWMRWAPIITAVQTAMDMKNAMNVVPGEFVANGHDYRADLAPFIREVFALPVTDAQMHRVEAALREYELARQQLVDAEKHEPAVAAPPEPGRRRAAA